MNVATDIIAETTYNVWELGPWMRIVDIRTNKADALFLATRFTREGRFTHVVTEAGSAYDKQLQKEAK